MVPLAPGWLLAYAAGAWFFTDDEDYLLGPNGLADLQQNSRVGVTRA
jgi:hypothetical protein